jgi:hypothetical protein
MKELTKEERYALAVKLDGILGADLMPEEEAAIEQAIEIISPEFAAGTADLEREAEEFFENATEEDLKKLDDWAKEKFPPRKDGRVLRFGQENKK